MTTVAKMAAAGTRRAIVAKAAKLNDVTWPLAGDESLEESKAPNDGVKTRLGSLSERDDIGTMGFSSIPVVIQT